MNFQSIEYIITLSKLLNFTKAAMALHTTQPAFSRAISSAEDELGIELFERSRRHVKLTPAGEELVPKLEKALELYRQGVKTAKRASTSYGGKLIIGYIPDTINQDLRMLTESFSQKYPDIAISLRETYYFELQSQLLTGELDVVIFTSMHTSFPPEFGCLPLFETPLCAVVNEQHPLSERESISSAELKDEPFIVLEHDVTMSGGWSFVHRFALAQGFSPWIAEQTSMLSSAILQVSCNKGICIASQFAGHLAPENVRIIPITDSESCYRYAVWCCERKNEVRDDFIKCISEHFL